jgi:hypothetical protein
MLLNNRSLFEDSMASPVFSGLSRRGEAVRGSSLLLTAARRETFYYLAAWGDVSRSPGKIYLFFLF